MKIDLHMHSTASDGQLTPSELVQRANNLHLDVVALTDHDSVAGIAEARRQGDEVGLQVLPGVEISCLWQGHEVHLLGWCFDPDHNALQDLLSRQQQARYDRIGAMLQRLAKYGVSNELLAPLHRRHQQGGESVMTRKHLADVLVASGMVRSVDEAFKRYLGKGQCAYVAPQWCSLSQAVHAIQQAGGATSLAHPLAYQLSTKWLKRLINTYIDAGGEALEVVSGQQTPQQRRWLAELASDYSLKASVGSDFHSPGRWRELGKNLQLPPGCKALWSDWPALQNSVGALS